MKTMVSVDMEELICGSSGCSSIWEEGRLWSVRMNPGFGFGYLSRVISFPNSTPVLMVTPRSSMSRISSSSASRGSR